MTENDFFVAVQGLMTAAKEAGYEPTHIHRMLCDATDEWMDEYEPMDEDE